MLILDHLVVSAETVAAGQSHCEAVLGQPMQTGGEHQLFQTHNALIGMGDIYLEAISRMPDAKVLERKRWYDLDRFSGAPRLTNWACRTDDLDGALEVLGAGYGAPVAVTRGSLAWRMAVPASGILPFDNCAPALLQWDTPPPTAGFVDRGCRLASLTVQHPDAGDLARDLSGVFSDPRVTYAEGPAALIARIDTPGGQVTL
ncbi:MAG: VOC family protein [Pseudomonadota bacterium]